ncbi:MAG: hypothetical protein IPO34_21830 [Dehalococcoidia bacterium]|nr:hypothetical protein [Dehalococcoidia bacterium]
MIRRRKYTGEFVDNSFHGSGVYTMPSGDNYTGDFKNGMYEVEELIFIKQR